jgi:hypothetical protein
MSRTATIITNATYVGPSSYCLANGQRLAWLMGDEQTGTVTVAREDGIVLTLSTDRVLHDLDRSEG